MFVFLLFLGIGVSGVLVQDTANYYERKQREQKQRSDETMREARQALIRHMLLRVESPLNIGKGASAGIEPRWLMLPCPDNIGDGDLDGSQDATCGSKSAPRVLESGSRFGRLPWRSQNQIRNKDTGTVVAQAINDGVDIDVRDVAGNRPWYALSRNLAPTESPTLPLNLHHLMVQREGWLTVVNHRGQTESEKVAAVIIAPGNAYQPRMSEQQMALAALETEDATAAEGLLHPARFFESYTITLAAATIAVTNFNRDDTFIRAAAAAGREFNDEITYIDMKEMVEDTHYFVRAHRELVGAGKMQNAPWAGRPLGRITAVLAAYRSLFGFYPTPAALQDVNLRKRHCARYDSGTVQLTAAVLPAGASLALAAPVTVFAAAGEILTATAATAVTVTLADAAPFLLREKVVAQVATATINYGGAAQTVSGVTLARHARITLHGATVALISGDAGGFGNFGDWATVSATVYRVPAAAAAVLLSAAPLTLAAETPLAPAGGLVGWFAEHNLPPRRAGNDGDTFVLRGNTRAMFWGETVLTMALSTVTLRQGDVLTLTAGSPLHFEEDYAHLHNMAAEIFYKSGAAATISAAKPTTLSFNRRQFAVWLLADMVRLATQTVQAPAVLFPWRKKETDKADSRDNIHAYPPCFDVRNFFGRRFEETIKDQPIMYAVAAECHYGGDPAACGRRGGITVSIAAGGVIAMPAALTLTHSYAATVGNFLTVTLLGGVVQGTSHLTAPGAYPFPVLNAAGATLASFRMPPRHTISAGAAMVIPAATPLIGGEAVSIEQVPALLIYSPAPLPRTRCSKARVAQPAVHHTARLGAFFNQWQVQNGIGDLAHLCYWLDDSENADGDDFYILPGKPEWLGAGLRNDYFILLGGRVRV